MIKKGFSLIELIVVIAIVAILAAIAVPVYRDLQIRAKVTEAVIILENYKRTAIATFERTGALPVTVVNNAVTDNINSRYVNTVTYYRTAGQPNSIWYQAVLNAANVGIPSNANQIIMIVGYNKTSKVLESHCGQWNPTGYVDTKYLPAGCNETNVDAWEVFYTNQ